MEKDIKPIEFIQLIESYCLIGLGDGKELMRIRLRSSSNALQAYTGRLNDRLNNKP